MVQEGLRLWLCQSKTSASSGKTILMSLRQLSRAHLQQSSKQRNRTTARLRERRSRLRRLQFKPKTSRLQAHYFFRNRKVRSRQSSPSPVPASRLATSDWPSRDLRSIDYSDKSPKLSPRAG